MQRLCGHNKNLSTSHRLVKCGDPVRIILRDNISQKIPIELHPPLFAIRNMGPYSYVLPRIMTATRELNGDEKRARYVGRSVSAAPATGMGKVHQQEYQHILNGVFGGLSGEGLGD